MNLYKITFDYLIYTEYGCYTANIPDSAYTESKTVFLVTDKGDVAKVIRIAKNKLLEILANSNKNYKVTVRLSEPHNKAFEVLANPMFVDTEVIVDEEKKEV